MRLHLLLVLLLLITACGKDSDQEYEDAITTANNYLSVGDCQSAIDVLEELNHDSNRILYTKTLASAYACRAGYSTPSLFGSDLAKINPLNLLGSFTTFTSSSNMNAIDTLPYLDLQVAIDLLLYTGGLSSSNNPTSAKRILRIGASEAADVNAFLMYLLMAQMGKYFYYYGNPDSTGKKTACIANYTNDGGGAAEIYLATGLTATCDDTNYTTSGHVDLGGNGSLNVQRMCQGAVLLNNFLDVFPSVIASASGTDFNQLAGVDTAISSALAKLITTDSQTLAAPAVSATSQSVCEAAYASNNLGLQYYFIYIVELLFQDV